MVTDGTDGALTISREVTVPSDFRARVASVAEEIRLKWDHRGPSMNPSGNGETTALIALATTVETIAAPRHPGVRGQVTAMFKSGIRRLLYWYVEPRWSAQQRLNEALVRQADQAARQLETLELELTRARNELERAQAANMNLRRQLARAGWMSASAGEVR